MNIKDSDRLIRYRGKLPLERKSMPYGKKNSTGAAGTTKAGKVRITKTVVAPVRGQTARISKFHASRGKTSVKFTTPRRGSQY